MIDAYLSAVARAWAWLRYVVLHLQIAEADRWMRACHAEGIVDGESLSIWRLQMTSDLARLAELHAAARGRA